jgi:hypothetical protein
MSHQPDLIDQITEGSWMEGKRPCSECSFVIPNEEAASNGGMCDQCMATHIPQPEHDEYNPHSYWSIEDWREYVAGGDTYLGYGEWVQFNVQRAADKLSQLEEEFEEDPSNEVSEEIVELRKQLGVPDSEE